MLMVTATFAQKVNYDAFSKTSAPEIDGIEDGVWDNVKAEPIAKPLGAELPTVTATFKSFYDAENVYILLNVEDDNHWPSWESGAAEHWNYDKPEIYFDVNPVLVDGLGGKNSGDGHWQLAPPFADGSYDVLVNTGTGDVPNTNWAYSLTGESYVVEYAVPMASLKQQDGTVLDKAGFEALPEKMGFDVSIIDQDEAITTGRNRAVWSSDGSAGEGEAWANMDNAGTITFKGPSSGVKSIAAASMNVYPNPVIDQLTINAKFNKVVISNLVGQQVKTIETSNKTINVSSLSKGVYVVKAFNNGKQVGTAKITKN